MEVQDYQILDQYSDEQVWCPSQLLALMPHLCVLPTTYIACTALDGKYPYLPLLVLPQIFPSSYYSLSTSLYFMPHMTRISHLKLKRGLATGLELGNIVEMQ